MYGVFIDNNGNLQIEDYDDFDDDYYIYWNKNIEKCNDFVLKYKGMFKTYSDYYSFLQQWCENHNINFIGCCDKFNELAI